MTAAERGATVGAEYIQTPDFEGVIFPAGYTYVPEHHWLYPNWTPSRDLVLAAESRLPAFLRAFPPYQGDPQKDRLERLAAPLILTKLSQYRRQYSGIVFEGQPAVYINCFAHDRKGDWVTRHVFVCDGGHDYFQIIYRPEPGDFPWFAVNGEA